MFGSLVASFVRGLLDRSRLSRKSAGYGTAPHNRHTSLEGSVVTTVVDVPSDTQFHCRRLQLPLRVALAVRQNSTKTTAAVDTVV
jgi:hypothetical protein